MICFLPISVYIVVLTIKVINNYSHIVPSVVMNAITTTTTTTTR